MKHIQARVSQRDYERYKKAAHQSRECGLTESGSLDEFTNQSLSNMATLVEAIIAGKEDSSNRGERLGRDNPYLES